MATKPKRDIDAKQVRKLAEIGLNNVEIAGFFGCDETTIRKRFPEYLTKGEIDRVITLKTGQYMAAKRGNIAMLIWLGKNELGQSDKVETKSEVTTRVHPADQRAMLANERAMQLACDYDAEISKPSNGRAPTGDDPGRFRPSGQ
jgi:hypothetical protein